MKNIIQLKDGHIIEHNIPITDIAIVPTAYNVRTTTAHPYRPSWTWDNGNKGFSFCGTNGFDVYISGSILTMRICYTQWFSKLGIDFSEHTIIADYRSYCLEYIRRTYITDRFKPYSYDKTNASPLLLSLLDSEKR